MHIIPKVAILPLACMVSVKKLLTKLIIGLDDGFSKLLPPVLSELKINSKKGMSMPIEMIEKIIDKTINKKYRAISFL
jgi:hypothetical protein